MKVKAAFFTPLQKKLGEMSFWFSPKIEVSPGIVGDMKKYS